MNDVVNSFTCFSSGLFRQKKNVPPTTFFSSSLRLFRSYIRSFNPIELLRRQRRSSSSLLLHFVVSLIVVFLLQELDAYAVVPNHALTVKNNDDNQKAVRLGQIGGLAASLQNPNLLFIFHRGSIQWNQK